MLHPLRFGLAGGILWSVGMVIMLTANFLFGYGFEVIGVLNSIYPGANSVSLLGIVLGAIYGFFDAFIGLWIFAWIYNTLGGNKA